MDCVVPSSGGSGWSSEAKNPIIIDINKVIGDTTNSGGIELWCCLFDRDKLPDITFHSSKLSVLE